MRIDPGSNFWKFGGFDGDDIWGGDKMAPFNQDVRSSVECFDMLLAPLALIVSLAPPAPFALFNSGPCVSNQNILKLLRYV